MFDVEKIVNWFLVYHTEKMKIDGYDESLTQMKLHKLLYYAQGIFLGVYSDKVFSEDILAWQHGPVVYSVYNKYRGVKEIQDPITQEEFEDYKEISKNSHMQLVLEFTYSKYGSFSAGRLRNMTHREAPWVEAWNESKGFTKINETTLEEYFNEKYSEENIIKQSELSYIDDQDRQLINNLFVSYFGVGFDGYTVEVFPNESDVYITIYDKSLSFEDNLEVFKVIKEETRELDDVHFLIGG